MGRLHASYFKVVTAGGDLDAATERELAKNVVTLTGEGKMVEHIVSDNPNPVERYEIGTGFNLKGVIVYDDDQDAVDLLGGSITSSVYTKTHGIRTLPKKDIRVGVYRKDGEIVTYDLTDMNFMPKVEAAFEQDKRTYLPFELMSTSTSDLTIDNSAA